MQANEGQGSQSQAIAKNQNGEARRKKGEVSVHADRSKFDQVGRDSTETRSEPVRSVGTNDPPVDAHQRKIPIRQVLGKILSRVDELEAKHLAYVESHEKRLEQRLSESKVSKEEALQLIAEIREMTALLDKQLNEEEEE